MLRIFCTIIEDSKSKLDFQKFIDKDFLKDVSLEEFSKDILMQETKLITDIEYEKRGAYLSGREEGEAFGLAKVSGLTELEIKSL